MHTHTITCTKPVRSSIRIYLSFSEQQLFPSFATSFYRSNWSNKISWNHFLSDTSQPLTSKVTTLKLHRDFHSTPVQSSYLASGGKMLPMNERLSLVRDLMKAHQIDAFIVPTDDAHSSENPAACDARREYISGFTGSAGTAVVTLNEALLWTDGRYWTQAEKELDLTLWKLMKSNTAGVPTIANWLKKSSSVKRVGFDPSVTSIATYNTISSALAELLETPKEYVALEKNLVDLIWDNDGRPATPASEVFVLGMEHAGETVSKKVENVRNLIRDENVDGVVLAGLDETAWITNMRGSDISFCPLFMSFVYISQTQFILYVNDARLTSNAKTHLQNHQIEIRPYNDVYDDISTLYGKKSDGKSRLWLDSSANSKLFFSVDIPRKRVVVKLSPVQLPKAIKNSVELEGMKEAHIKDALAECTFLAWLEDMASNREDELATYNEFTVANILDSFRKKLPDNFGLSFATISSVGPNGAIIHYRAHKDTARSLSKDVYLVDSGGQYLQGTTDITRTVHLGTPTPLQKECYTLVLKGHLNLSRQKFPAGTRDVHLDAIARQYLWNLGLNYNHGTGHGVGSFLNVHEGPQSITTPSIRESMVIRPGMVFSNEPGMYQVDCFGIRIENLLFCKRHEGKLHPFHSNEYLEFEELTLVPYHKQLIDLNRINDEVGHQ